MLSHNTSKHTSAYVSIQHTSAYVSIRQHTLAFTITRQHTSAYVSIRHYTSAYVSIRQHSPAFASIRQHSPAYASIRQHTPAYVSIRQHTSAYASIRQHTSAYVSTHFGGSSGAVVLAILERSLQQGGYSCLPRQRVRDVKREDDELVRQCAIAQVQCLYIYTCVSICTFVPVKQLKASKLSTWQRMLGDGSLHRQRVSASRLGLLCRQACQHQHVFDDL